MGDADVIDRALAAFGFAGATVVPIGTGNIHQTFAVDVDDTGYVLQRVNPIFSLGIHANIAAVTEHLRARGVPALTLLRTEAGSALADLGEAGHWRLMTRLPGVSHDVCASTAHARAAGSLVAGFHCALADLEHRFEPLGIVWHAFDTYLDQLEGALVLHRGAPLHGEVAALAQRVRVLVREWPRVDTLPERVVHTDLKFNNLLFDETADPPRATSLIDLDTVCRLPLYIELGDAWRSWCNRRGEDSAEAELDLDFLRAAVRGYLGSLTLAFEPGERASLALALERMSAELAIRFATDVLEDAYFGWDAERFESRAEHNHVRALGQISLAEQARDSRAEQAEILGIG